MIVARFTVAYGCVFVAVLLPILCTGIAKFGMFGQSRQVGGYDNHMPRDWLAAQEGWRARANAAQANSFEGLPFFIGAVIIAHLLGAAQGTLDLLAFSYVFLRLLYIMLYLADAAMARTAVWTVAFAVNTAIFFLGYH